ncbi:NAD-dependent epimerase/dehydratase family protein [Actinomadura rudentiformis]|uniref:NAD-dependent epimerase/dehydratase family protein n=1 Tax=Actinomadura rudentiformis TaxID=359158 RepID=A0A6H9YFJ3_9ACTN|nr:NAD-dependent epimerase/dehydratase family protein [Actinomadura rudentiformis]KAB2343399.1 NAD-dependent epimerase/dehydratase family protein [Actinomadura rudentiformis]
MATGKVRPRRSKGPVVAVTGAASGAGRLLAARLAERAAHADEVGAGGRPPSGQRVRKVVAIDGHRGDVPGVTWRVVDIRDPLLSNRLSDVDVIVHADLEYSPELDPRERRTHNVRGAQTVVTAAAAARVRRVILVTSAMVYGAGPDNEVPLNEDAPLLAEANASIAGDFLEIEDLAASAPITHPGLEVTVVRPATLVGPGIDTVMTRHFEAPRLLSVKGSTPAWQFCHIEDLAAALEVVVVSDVTGPVAVTCEGWLGSDEVSEITGKRSFELPAAVTFGMAQRLHRLGMTPAPATDLHYVTYPWVVDAARLRAAGWKPAYDNATALRVLMDESAGRHAVVGRRVGGKEATMATAAGATVAAIGAAAAIRRARKRRR